MHDIAPAEIEDIDVTIKLANRYTITSRKQGFRPGLFSPLVPVQSRTGTNASIYPGSGYGLF